MRGPSVRRVELQRGLAQRAAVWLVDRRLAFEIPFLGVLPVALELWLLTTVLPGDQLGADLRYAFLPAANDVLSGDSPFPPPGDPSIQNEHAYVYPPLAAFLLVPFTALSVLGAAIAAIVLLALAFAATLWLLGVRDWRCYTIVCAWAPLHDGLFTASISIALALLLALAWRYRDHVGRGAAVLGLACSLKLFLAPVLVWPLARGRRRAAVLGAAVAGVLVLAPWAVLGFADITWYPRLLEQVARAEETESFSLVSAFAATGLPVAAARACSLAIGAALFVACWLVGRRGDDLRCLTLAILASLALSPIAWEHYWTILVVPLALTRPRFSGAWLLPVVLWIGLFTRDYAEGRAAAVLLAAVFGALLLRRLPQRRAQPRRTALDTRLGPARASL